METPKTPNFFSEGLMIEPLSPDDLREIATATQNSETQGYYDEVSGKIFFTDKGVSTTFTFDEDAQRFVIERTHDLMADKDPHTHQGSRPVENINDINQARAVALHEALAELRNQDVKEE